MKALQREIWKWWCSADEVNQTHKCRWSRGLFGGLFLFFSKKAVEQNDWPNFSPATILHVHTAPNHQQAEPLEHMWGYVAEVHGQTPNSACMNLSMVIWFMYISMGERINVKCRLKHMWHIWSCDLLNLIITRGDLIHVWCNQKCLQYSYWSSGNLRIPKDSNPGRNRFLVNFIYLLFLHVIFIWFPHLEIASV